MVFISTENIYWKDEPEFLAHKGQYDFIVIVQILRDCSPDWNIAIQG